MSAEDQSPVSMAESLFARLFVEGEEQAEARLAALCSAHPELAAELVELARQRAAMRSVERELFEAQGDGVPGRLGNFELVRPLGRGGMGVVWEARDLHLRRTVALKLLQRGERAGERELSRFRREAEAAGRVNHRGVVAVFSAGEVEGRRYIVQELVPGGRTLREWIEERRALLELPAEHYRETALLFLELTEALAAAHAAGIVHRDLKPQNVLLTAEGMPKVADFGLAMLEGDASLSTPGDFIGTYLYASPEQASGGRGRLDARSDVFSLGATLYECLTLRRAFDGDSVQQIVRQLLEQDPPEPRTVRSRVPDDLALIVMKALEKRPEARYESMAAFHEDLRRHLADEPILARAPTLVQRAAKWMRRHPTWTTAAALSAGALTVVSLLLVRVWAARSDEARANESLSAANVELGAARDAAWEAADEARRESEAREEVIAFLAGLFQAADPELEENPSARTLLDRGLERIRAGQLQDPGARARLLRTIGAVHMTLGRFAEAEPILSEAVAIWDELGLDGSDEAVRAALEHIGALAAIGQGPAATDTLAPLLPRAEAGTLPSELRWQVWSSQGSLALSQGRYAEGEQALDRAEALCFELHGRGSQEHLTLQIVRAGAAWYLGQRERAEGLLVGVIEAGRKGLSWGDPTVLEAVNLLGLVQTDNGRLEEAEQTFESTIQSLRDGLGEEHPSVLTVENNLARVWEAQGRHPEAEALYRRIAEASSRQLGRGNSQTLRILNNLGTCLARQQRFGEAAELHREVLEGRRAALGRLHPDSLGSANNLAYALFLGGDPAQALELQEEVVAGTPADSPQHAGRAGMLEDIRRALAAAR